MANSVEVSSTGQVVVTEVAEQIIEITSPTAPLTVEVQTAGPQAPPVTALNDIGDVNTTAAVDKSVLYFDQATSTWRGNDINTITTITDGGNY